ncbi:MAG: prepilin signal peptidase PulO-like enzyme (type II secretory pathway) [Cyclobacteriaceae bacterium]|jgi:prepilin signal peptidase PulO-like enzyme (type II secretory pathway)
MEESNNITVKSVSIKYGLISALVGIIFFILLDFMGQATNRSLTWIGIIFSIAIMYLAHNEFKKEGDGYMSYKQGLNIGTLMSVIASVINGVFTFVYVKFINPEFTDAIREQQLLEMEKRGMSDAEISQAMEIAEMFIGPVAMLIYSIVFGILIGFILALIISAVTKKVNPEFV